MRAYRPALISPVQAKDLTNNTMRYNPAGAMSKPKTYLRLPEIPTLVTSRDLRGSKALVLLGYRDCSYETHRYMVEVENMPEDDPLVLGLQQHLEQHWLRMDIQTLLSDVLDKDDTDCNANSESNVSVGSGVSNGTDSYCSREDSGDDGGGGSNSVREQCVSHRRHLCHRHPLHRRHRHHPHQRDHHHHHHPPPHHQRIQPCSQPPTLLHNHQSFLDTLSHKELNLLEARVTGIGNERSVVDGESQRTDNDSSKKHELQLELPVTSDIIVKPEQSPSSSSESEADRSSERALLTSENNNPLLAIHTTNNNSTNNNNGINEISNNNDMSLKEEDPERWKQLNLSIARVTQELIVLLENEGSSLSDEDEEGYEEEEEVESDGDLVQDIDLDNGLEK